MYRWALRLLLNRCVSPPQKWLSELLRLSNLRWNSAATNTCTETCSRRQHQFFFYVYHMSSLCTMLHHSVHFYCTTCKYALTYINEVTNKGRSHLQIWLQKLSFTVKWSEYCELFTTWLLHFNLHNLPYPIKRKIHHFLMSLLKTITNMR